MGRAFTERQKRILACGSSVEGDALHADHIVPYSAGGDTDVANGQLLTDKANQQKGDTNLVLRLWQREANAAWKENKNGQPFMLVAVPAGGKTFAALYMAARWLRAGKDRRIIVVVPTSQLQEQWKDEASKLGIQLQTKELGGTATYKHGFQGGATTYQFVGMNSMYFRYLTSNAPTMVIFDEVHHCGDNANWGNAVKEAFQNCEEKLLMSGTPFRTDGSPIPFVEYDNDGFCKADYTFDYKRALKEGVIRYVAFEYARGSYTGHNGEEQVSYEVHSGITEDEAAYRLRHLLNPDGEFVADCIKAAHERLVSVRATIPDAGGIIACMDQTHAQRVAHVVKRVTGCTPAIIVSDNDLSNATVRGFRDSRAEWVVAVRKIAEGTDIKRLQVLCYFTNVSTDQFFRQIVGRVQRRRNIGDSEGYVFLPADPRLIACAERIAELQVQAILEEVDEEKEDREATEPTERPGFTFFDSQHTGVELTLIDGVRYPPGEYAIISRMAEVGQTSLEKAAAMYTVARQQAPQQAQEDPIHDSPAVPLEDQRDALAKVCNRLVNVYSKITGIHQSEIHMEFPRHTDMTVQQFQKKRDTLAAWIKAKRK